MPVYLQLNSKYPSGHYSKNILEKNTRALQTQRWIRVKRTDGKVGWIPESELITALDLARQAGVNEAVPIRLNPEVDSAWTQIIPANSVGTILIRIDSWTQVEFSRPSPKGDIKERAWIPNENLAPISSEGDACVNFRSAGAFTLPFAASRLNGIIKAWSTGKVVKTYRPYTRVEYNGVNGYVLSEYLAYPEKMIREKITISRTANPIRSAPAPYADVVAHIHSGETLQLLEATTIQWGSSYINNLGWMWWPIVDEMRGEMDPITGEPKIHLSVDQVLSRKIFDQVLSPAIPNLRVVSADGIFLTRDGSQFLQIDQFKGRNYPLAIAPQGTIFVGPYISDDHGETFQQWIRWDRLIASIPARRRQIRHLQLLSVRPLDAFGRSVQVELGLGHSGGRMLLISRDQGQSWAAAQ